MQGGFLPHERFISCFEGDRVEGYSILLIQAISQATLIQNSKYAKVRCLGVANFLPYKIMILHLWVKILDEHIVSKGMVL